MAPGSPNVERFALMYDAHCRALVAFCRRRLSHDVDDVVSEVFLTAWRRIDEIPPDAELPWLYAVARNVVLNQQRSIARRSRLRVRLRARRTDTSTDTMSERLDCDPAVRHALATLSEADQEVLRLRAWEDLSSVEAGVVLGISASAVDTRLARARRRFERALRMEGAASPGVARLVEEASQ